MNLKMMSVLITILIWSWVPNSASGGDDCGCSKMLIGGVFNSSYLATSSQASSAYRHWQCTQEFSTHQQALDSGLSVGLPVYGIPIQVGGSFNASTRDSWKRKNCQDTRMNSSSENRLQLTLSVASTTILTEFNRCQEICNTVGLHCWTSEVSGDTIRAVFKARWGSVASVNQVEILGFDIAGAKLLGENPHFTKGSKLSAGVQSAILQRVDGSNESGYPSAIMLLKTSEGDCIAALPSIPAFIPPPPPPNNPFEKVRFYHKFWADGDPGQCNGAFMGTDEVGFGEWTHEVRIDADRRPGGCFQQFAIRDPDSVLAGLRITVDFRPDGVGQCDEPGNRIIPITTTGELTYSPRYRIDTDERPGGCLETFSIEGRNDIFMDVSIIPDGDSNQCGNPGTHTVQSGSPAQIRIDTDGRPGGCRERFRLRERK